VQWVDIAFGFLLFSGLLIDLIALILVIRKFSLLENIFLLQWKKSCVVQVFAMFGFSVWFFTKTMVTFSPTFERDFEVFFLILTFFSFLLGDWLLAGLLLRGARNT